MTPPDAEAIALAADLLHESEVMLTDMYEELRKVQAKLVCVLQTRRDAEQHLAQIIGSRPYRWGGRHYRALGRKVIVTPHNEPSPQIEFSLAPP